MAQKLTEQDGRRALRDHLLEKAAAARVRHGPCIDSAGIGRVMADRDVVRYPTGIRFAVDGLEPGEFAHAQPLGERPSEGFCLFVHPVFETRPDTWPWLFSYHLPPINYGDIASAEDCEAFGAALLGVDVETYYNVLCELADSAWGSLIPGSDL